MPAIALAGVLVTGVLVSPATPAGAAPEVTTAPSTVAALAAAARSHSRVEALDRRSETEQVFAEPDGRLTAQIAAVAQRVRRADGTWTPVDPTLRRNPDGSLAPVATPLALTISGGGDGPLLTMRKDGRALSLSWPGRLPAPRVDAGTVTYPDVLPDVDLTIAVTATGFSQVLVVRSRAAAENPALARIRLTTAGDGLRLQARDGAVAVVDQQGTEITSSGTAMMWDSMAETGGAPQPVPEGASGAAQGRPASGRRARMPVSVDSGSISVAPDLAMLAAPDTHYPVSIDPGFNTAGWTNVSGTFPDQSYWSCGAVCDRTYAKVGFAPTDAVLYRSMFRFPIGAFAHGTVSSAVFSATLKFSSSCTKHDTQLWRTGDINAGTTWRNASWIGSVATRSSEACDSVALRDEWSVTGLAQQAADEAWSVLGLGLKAPNESSTAYWKKYDPASAYLTVEYNLPPSIPDKLTVDNRPCGTGPDRAFVGLPGAPVLRARASDPDGGALTVRFQLDQLRGNGTHVPYLPTGAALVQNSVPSGQTAQVPVPGGSLHRGDTLVGAGDWDSDGHTDVLVHDAGDNLLLLPGDGTTLGPRVDLGGGWAWLTVAGVGDWDRDGKLDVLARDETSDGQLYLYPGNGSRAPLTDARIPLGGGWGSMTFAGVGDWDLDGRLDVLARADDTADGRLSVFPGHGDRSTGTADPVDLGPGWEAVTFLGLADLTGDRRLDIVGRDDQDENAYYHPGTSTGGVGARQLYATGWGGIQAVAGRGLSGARANDIFAVPPTGDRILAYPGTASGTPSPVTIATFGIADGDYTFRATAGDANTTGAWSGWCEFTLDTIAPSQMPSITSSDYPADGLPHGGTGRGGIFTLGAGGVADVTGYLYGTVDPPSNFVAAPSLGASMTVPVTPTATGQNTLFVKSVDRAGNTSPRVAYTFLAGEASAPVGRWQFADGAPTADTGQPGGLPLTLVGGAGTAAGVATFNGSTGYATTATAPVDTAGSFSVGAWVRLAQAPTGTVTAASAPGTHTGAFQLSYAADSKKWTFTTRQEDTATAQESTVIATAPATIGVWTHLLGIYDAPAGQIRLYVNGVAQGSAATAAVFAAPGGLELGRDRHADQVGDWWPGDLDDVRIYDRTVVDTEIVPVATGADLTSPVINLAFDEGDGRSAADLSGNNHPATLTGTAGWGQGNPQDDPTDTALLLDGLTAGAATAGPVLRTDQAFTLTAWVNPAVLETDAVVAALNGTQAGAVTIEYRSDTASWCATWRAADATDAEVHTACGGTVTVGFWTHLAAVYDPLSGVLRLYVNGIAVRETTVTSPWNATGALTIGFVPGGVGLTGRIDDVIAYQSVLSEPEIRRLASS